MLDELMSRFIALLGEHADAYVLMIQVKDGEDSTKTMMNWGGGFNNAMGIVHRAALRLDKAAMDADSPPDDSSDDGEAWKTV